MKLLVIRHGESEADLLSVYEGRADYELTQRGQDQAKAMAKWVKQKYTLDKIYASTLRRAKQTANALSDVTGCPILYQEELMEFNNGQIAGLSRKEANEKYPKIEHLPYHKSVYGMESMLQFRYRADYILSEIITSNDKNATIAIVTHGGMINQLYYSFLQLPMTSNVMISTSDTGIHEWYLGHNERGILFANKTSHLINNL